MIPAKQPNILRIFYFQTQKKNKCFYRIWTAIDIISKKQIRTFRRSCIEGEEGKKIIVLAVKITDNIHRRFDLNNNWIIHQNFGGFDADPCEIGGIEFHKTTVLVVPGTEKVQEASEGGVFHQKRDREKAGKKDWE
jgi:hypothetical protein